MPGSEEQITRVYGTGFIAESLGSVGARDRMQRSESYLGRMEE